MPTGWDSIQTEVPPPHTPMIPSSSDAMKKTVASESVGTELFQGCRLIVAKSHNALYWASGWRHSANLYTTFLHYSTQWPPFTAAAGCLCSGLRGINVETPSKPQRDLWGDESFTAPLQLPPPSSLPRTSACQTGQSCSAPRGEDGGGWKWREGCSMASIISVFIHELEGRNVPRGIRKRLPSIHCSLWTGDRPHLQPLLVI